MTGGDLYLHQVGVYDVLLGQQPVLHLPRAHGGGQVELAQVPQQQTMHRRHVLPGHWSQARCLWSLKGVYNRMGQLNLCRGKEIVSSPVWF